MINGVINVYKEAGYTSHDVIAILRGILSQKKIGHTGTLDPEAKGVLPVCLGNATKVSEIIIDKSKTYEVVGLLGVVTDTHDIYGKTIETNEVNLEAEQVINVINSFLGEYSQIPPMYSALKVGGYKLYELARQGQEVERKARKVQIHKIDIIDIDLKTGVFKLIVECSKGTYIRTLIHDIGKLLGCGGCMKDLLRTRVGSFDISSSKTLDEIEEIFKGHNLDSLLIEVDQLFTNYDKIIILEEYTKVLYNGNMILSKYIENYKIDKKYDKVLVYDYENQFKAIYQYKEDKNFFKPFKMFL